MVASADGESVAVARGGNFAKQAKNGLLDLPTPSCPQDVYIGCCSFPKDYLVLLAAMEGRVCWMPHLHEHA